MRIDEISPFTALARKIKPVINKDRYQRVAEKLHAILLRKKEENGGVFRHALGWYTMNIGQSYKNIDHHVLRQYYLDNFEPVVTD
jgi:rhamnogalacturonyl hydrolase YesR